MRSMARQNKKIKLGKKTAHGYEYSTKINFNEDISLQLAQIIQETDIEEALEKEIKHLKGLIKKFPRKEKNIFYYYTLGKKLLFLEENFFKKVARYSIFRRIIEELPEILPHLQNSKRAVKHLDFMYNIAHLDKKYLSKASWDQWCEIMKFKYIYKKKRLFRKILLECQKGVSGMSLRKKIKELRKR